jgi:hypothetical protein
MSLDVLKNVLLSLNQPILEFVTGKGSTPSDSDFLIRTLIPPNLRLALSLMV